MIRDTPSIKTSVYEDIAIATIWITQQYTSTSCPCFSHLCLWTVSTALGGADRRWASERKSGVRKRRLGRKRGSGKTRVSHRFAPPFEGGCVVEGYFAYALWVYFHKFLTFILLRSGEHSHNHLKSKSPHSLPNLIYQNYQTSLLYYICNLYLRW